MGEKAKKQSEEPQATAETTEQNEAGTGENTGNPGGTPFTEKIGEVADKSAKVLKEVFERVTHVASEAADSTRIRMDLYRLKSDRDKLFTEVGRKTYELHRSDSMKEWQKAIGASLQKIADLEARIQAKEDELSKISLDFKGKPQEADPRIAGGGACRFTIFDPFFLLHRSFKIN